MILSAFSAGAGLLFTINLIDQIVDYEHNYCYCYYYDCCSAGSYQCMCYIYRLWLCTFTLAVSGGAVLLLPLSIIANEALLIFPNSYYLQWINSSLISGQKCLTVPVV